MIKTVKAKKVREGDFIPGLNNGYVPWASERIDDFHIRIIMHDQNGNEFYLECDKNMLVTVERKA